MLPENGLRKSSGSSQLITQPQDRNVPNFFTRMILFGKIMV